MDPCANEYIARLTRELEGAMELIRDLVDDEDAGLVWLGRRLVCAYCTAEGLYSVAHAADCPIIRARHAIAGLRSDAQGEAGPEDIARRIARDCRLLFDQTPEEDAELRRAMADLAEGIEARLEWIYGPARRGEGGGDG